MSHSLEKRKLFVAHFMVGNTIPYTVDDWREDIELAGAHGIDAFALNVGSEPWQRGCVSKCFAAALCSTQPFKLFLSFDMSSIHGSSREHVHILREYIAAFADHPCQLRYEGKVLASTFSGQDSLFGHTTLQEGWQYVKSVLESVAPIHLVPSFFIDPRRYPTIGAMDGYFNWNGGWPIHLTLESPRKDVEHPKLDTDRHHIHHLEGRTFMAAVSPWFFTHYGPDSWNKNWVYPCDDWLYVRRWEQLVAMRDQVDIVQLISWNGASLSPTPAHLEWPFTRGSDYGESHYVGPIKGAQPNSLAWVDGFPHTAWLDLTRYYARAFKEGAYPQIEHDKIYLWARPHLKNAEAVDDPVGRPDRWQLVEDTIWLVVFTAGPAEVRISTGDNDPGQVWTVGRGVHKLSHPMMPGRGVAAQVIREGLVVAQCAPSTDEFVVQERPQKYNFNAFVAMSA
ncbi:glycoside hydrolase family 71 protein [Trametes polyzona]|nr:glycoside hydrolase family 71 protein [Trametes polyzona]